MKWVKAACVFIVLFGLFSSTAAWAHRGHFVHTRAHVGVFFGVPLGGPYYYPPPSYYYPYPYYYPPVVAVPATPPVYVERADAQQAPQQSSGSNNWWYYCSKPQGYYPYIKECPVGWQRVAPQPSSQP